MMGALSTSHPVFLILVLYWYYEGGGVLRLLIKSGGSQGLVAHMVDAQGLKLCNIRLKLTDWEVQERPPQGIIICYHCRRAEAKRAKG